jgi:hypothetical protein
MLLLKHPKQLKCMRVLEKKLNNVRDQNSPLFPSRLILSRHSLNCFGGTNHIFQVL